MEKIKLQKRINELLRELKQRNKIIERLKDENKILHLKLISKGTGKLGLSPVNNIFYRDRENHNDRH